MLETQELIVLSDLHLAPERDRGLFRADAELAAFLTWVREEVVAPAHVVIAGDILDFLVPEGEGQAPAFDPRGAADRARAILEHHPEACDALARLAASDRHDLTLISGNHDPELILPEAQEVVEARLRRGLRRPHLRWAVQGEALGFQVGAARVLVEHGDQFDDWNRIERVALQRALLRISRGFVEDHGYRPPPGTRVVVEYATPLGNEHPWIHVLKPERDAVIPILYQFLSLGERLRLLAFLASVIPHLAARRLLTAVLDAAGSSRRFRGPAEHSSRRKNLLDWLEEEQRSATRGIAEAPSRAKLITTLRKVSAEDGYFDLMREDEAAQPVGWLLGQGFDLVVAGHTHAAKIHTLVRGLYVNTGTWCRLLELPGSDVPEAGWDAFLNDLEAGRDLGAAKPTFLRLARRPERNDVEATLAEWSEGRPAALRRFRLASARGNWAQEG